MYNSFDPKELPTAQLHDYLLSTIAPRPIAWASTISKNGTPNLSPFSFFNVFSSNPPILVFSPSRRVRDNTTKHTLENARETGEVVINIVNYDLLGQMVLTSAEFDDEINEFEPAGLKMLPSVKVKPPRVENAPAQFECKVKDIISLGDGGGAGNLVICEVVHLHLNKNIFNGEGKIDPKLVDNIARMGKLFYSRAKDGIFELSNPNGKTDLGMENLPASIKNSRYFTQSELAILSSTNYRPSAEEVKMVEDSPGMQEFKKLYGNNKDELQSKQHSLAKTLINENKIEEAWRVLYAFGTNMG